MTTIHALAFGDLDTATWGFSWSGESGVSRLAARHGAVTEVLEGNRAPGPTDGAWHLDGDAISIAFEPTVPPRPGGTSGELETCDRVGRVTGRLSIGGEPLELECLGWHGSVEGLGELSAVSSFRWLAGWLGPSDGFSLIALRPRKARGHESDVVAASVIEEPPPPRIDDPRLSTTYTDAGLPIRAGLELWPEAPEAPDEVDSGADRAPHYPRRAAGEVVGDRLLWDADGFQLSGSPVRWRSHGRMGPGVYLLGQRA